jgi:hypothetical protein
VEPDEQLVVLLFFVIQQGEVNLRCLGCDFLLLLPFFFFFFFFPQMIWSWFSPPPVSVSGFPWLDEFLLWYMSSPWIFWGLGPSLASQLGFWSTAFLCEVLVAICPRSWLLVYSDEGSRARDIAETQSKISWRQQLWDTLMHVSGPTNLISVVILRYVFPHLMPHSRILPTLGSFAVHFVLLALLADLGL